MYNTDISIDTNKFIDKLAKKKRKNVEQILFSTVYIIRFVLAN